MQNTKTGSLVRIDPLIDGFDGLSNADSIAYQLKHWVAGKPLHNVIRDECCPDFSCCSGGEMMPLKVRQRFNAAIEAGNGAEQWAILNMGLGMLAADMDVNVHVAGQGQNEN